MTEQLPDVDQLPAKDLTLDDVPPQYPGGEAWAWLAGYEAGKAAVEPRAVNESLLRGLRQVTGHSSDEICHVAADEIQRLREDLRRTESAHAVVMAENTHYKAEVARLTSIIRGKTFVTDDKAAQPPGDG